MPTHPRQDDPALSENPLPHAFQTEYSVWTGGKVHPGEDDSRQSMMRGSQVLWDCFYRGDQSYGSATGLGSLVVSDMHGLVYAAGDAGSLAARRLEAAFAALDGAYLLRRNAQDPTPNGAQTRKQRRTERRLKRLWNALSDGVQERAQTLLNTPNDLRPYLSYRNPGAAIAAQVRANYRDGWLFDRAERTTADASDVVRLNNAAERVLHRALDACARGPSLDSARWVLLRVAQAEAFERELAPTQTAPLYGPLLRQAENVAMHLALAETGNVWPDDIRHIEGYRLLEYAGGARQGVSAAQDATGEYVFRRKDPADPAADEASASYRLDEVAMDIYLVARGVVDTKERKALLARIRSGYALVAEAGAQHALSLSPSDKTDRLDNALLGEGMSPSL